MKLSSKSIISSSPNRIDKYPTAPHSHPLSRFSRSNGGNRSRGRSRSSPMFSSLLRRKNVSSIETQEPSSPKVTCIGQVRVKRSNTSSTPKSSSATTTTTSKNPTHSICRWLQTALFCSRFPRKTNKHPRRSSSPPARRRRFTFLMMGYNRKHHHHKQALEEDRESKPGHEPAADESDSDSDSEEDEESKVFVSSIPPKNALLLMRCRSEPRRASALADRVWGSPSSSIVDNDAGEKENLRTCEDTIQGEEEEEDNEEDEEKLAQLGVSSRPLILPRCKSEPATRTGNLVPEEASIWKNMLTAI
ncbi:uncharacterized protein LOC131244215, partial [Magnolia sinica]|uniref:uncharacterized protein LOC131244215 n=1 Tax=Magnolia sinica TaxID=86752 RepID=UPI00265820D5